MFPEPDTLFDNYEGRGTAAKEQDMSIDITMRMKQDVKSNQPERQKELEALDPNDKKGLRISPKTPTALAAGKNQPSIACATSDLP